MSKSRSQANNTVPQLRLELATPEYEVKHSTNGLNLSVIVSMAVKMIKLPAIIYIAVSFKVFSCKHHSG